MLWALTLSCAAGANRHFTLSIPGTRQLVVICSRRLLVICASTEGCYTYLFLYVTDILLQLFALNVLCTFSDLCQYSSVIYALSATTHFGLFADILCSKPRPVLHRILLYGVTDLAMCYTFACLTYSCYVLHDIPLTCAKVLC